MSMNPQIGHLYHDGNISNACTVLDAKEKVKTREINAREAKTLNRYSGVIDRAKRVCRRQNEWEQLNIRKHLDNIKSKTPSLAISLRHESERIKLHSIKDVGNIKTNTVRPNIGDMLTFSAKDPRRKVKVSPWSIYSQLVDDRLHPGRVGEKCKTAPVSRYRSSRFKENSSSAKTENLAKRADQVTRSLHSLYTKSFERKWKEKDLTVLDILNKNSKEELEKALFVLRGTPTGETIEDILRDRELVSKSPSEKENTVKDLVESDDIEKLTDEIFITKLGETVLRTSDKGKPRSNSRTSLDREFDYSPRSSVSRVKKNSNNLSGQNEQIRPGNKKYSEEDSTNRWNDFENPLTTNEVFERDNSFMMSSTMANPSETDANPASHSWREIFKAPELWKQNPEEVNVNVKTKPVSIVTLTGKYRQTMLK